MKKYVFAIFIVLALVFSACGQTAEPREKFGIPMKITARLEGSDGDFTADIFENGCDITFDEGHALAGTSLCFREEGNTASVGDIFTREVKKGTFPAQEAFIKAVRLLAESEAAGEKTENGAKYTIDEMTIMVYYDKDTDRVTHIGTEENGRKFEFTVTSLELNEA